MELKSWIFCRYGSPTAINHPKTSPNIDKSTFKCTHFNKTGPTSLDIPQFQSNDSWLSTLCYYNNRDQRKKDSKKTSTATVAEIKTEANVAEKASALVAATDHGGFTLRPSSQKIVSTANGEYHKEIQTLDYDYHISEEDESGQSELVNRKWCAEALADPRWKAAMNEEMKSLQKNETWELVECPPGKKPVGCRWIYTVKYKADGSIERFKARLVAKGYTQTYGIDYTETFAPVAKINTIRVLLSLAANLDWPLQQFDVKNVFLHGELSEEQSPRAWFGRFTKSMRAFGYRQITGNDPEERKALQNYLSREFEMKDLGDWNVGMSTVNTPIEEGLKLCVEPNQVSTDKGRYQRLVGRLMYLAHTRPDLAYALSVVSQYMHNPGEQHMNAVMRILRYLKNAPGKGILFAKNVDHQSIEVYTDVDWAVQWMIGDLHLDLGYLSRQPIRLFCDNKAACDIAHNLVQHDRTKHVEVDRFFIKEKLDDKIVELPKIRSEDQLADILTKAVSSQVFSNFRQVGHV
ncbi:Retrovirus-related Pol polyprotein from transposon RE1 [Vitis vinifera]|uniref:Retrovirus-related Pol polyprotein from transposon RE1 n=1 Tax=Vitis vinifera TaxID=29760 RepID=A0A438D094_VITVI|nr:Retrovirus-related Pol polyprotein from transposon RE1 [Vitis vinifera]